MKETERTYYQECDGILLNVYRYLADIDDIGLEVGEIINDPAETHIEGEPHATIRRIS